MRITRPTLAPTPVIKEAGIFVFVALSLVLLLALTPWSAARAQEEPVNQGSSAAGTGDWCATQRLFDIQRQPGDASASAACPTFGTCDFPSVRDENIPSPDYPLLVIKLMFHIVANNDGSNPATTPTMIANQVVRLNEDYLPSRITFEYQYDYVYNTAFRSLAETEFDAMKAQYAVKPESLLNVFVSYVEASYSYGTFPWDNRALSPYGGIVMTTPHFSTVQSTLAHEVGHCLGLMHTQRGVSEVSACSDCYERAGFNDGDYVGDFCEDTGPTPTNNVCRQPGGTDQCSGNLWGQTDIQNFMGYSGDACWSEFSTQQMGRMHCWINSRLQSWTTGVRFAAANSFGPAPLSVDFTGITGKAVSLWEWDFGDGQTSNQQSPQHVYSQPGVYDVSVAIQSTDGPYEFLRPQVVWAYADSLKVETEVLQVGQPIVVDITARNFVPVNEMVIPFSWAGPAELILDSVSTAGLRTAYMQNSVFMQYDTYSERVVYFLGVGQGPTQVPLAPGNGPVLRAYFHAESSFESNPIEIISYSTPFGSYEPKFTAFPGNYTPGIVQGAVISCRAGDINNDGIGPDLGDLATLIAYLVGATNTLPNPSAANVNAIGIVDLSDLAYLIAYLVAGGPDPKCT